MDRPPVRILHANKLANAILPPRINAPSSRRTVATFAVLSISSQPRIRRASRVHSQSIFKTK
eukprot:1933213-Pleurochrysis_carterae.AAC.1